MDIKVLNIATVSLGFLYKISNQSNQQRSSYLPSIGELLREVSQMLLLYSGLGKFDEVALRVTKV